MNYYNEIDPFAAQWLRELIKENLIPYGDVDERSIEDVTPNELKSYTQCHFFAGIGGWSLALRYAGWPEDRPVWTGSAPCQPFSTAGQGAGFNDERHLWPAFFWLIRQCQPPTIFGEQVSGKLGFEWWDLVAYDLESQGYAATAFDLPAAAVGTPHKRQRLYWLAHSIQGEFRSREISRHGETENQNGNTTEQLTGSCFPCDNLGNPQVDRLQRIGSKGKQITKSSSRSGVFDGACDGTCALVDPHKNKYQKSRGGNGQKDSLQGERREKVRSGQSGRTGRIQFDGGWHWHECTDGRFRPVPTEPGLFPLAYGVPSRVGQLRGYGNAIVPQVGAEFIRAYIEANP